jgi:hypothetical protein
MTCLFISFFIVFNLFSYSEAGTIPAGYEKVGWNSSVESVRVKYPGGQIVTLADAIIYRQYKPVNNILRRNFAFKNGFLRTVSVTLEKRYVVKLGVEKLRQDYVRKYGDGQMDSSQAPHIINCVWEDSGTRIYLSYAPKRPDMTVIIFESAYDAVTHVKIKK